MGMIVKSKKTQRLFSEININYNPKKRLQYCYTYPTKEGYINNIKDQCESLISTVSLMIISPFVVLYQLYKTIQSLFPYGLVYTKKNLKEDN